MTTFPIRVKIRLAQTQKITEKEWNFTHAGIPKVVESEWVIYMAVSFEAAFASFDSKEIQSVLIEKEI